MRRETASWVSRAASAYRRALQEQTGAVQVQARAAWASGTGSPPAAAVASAPAVALTELAKRFTILRPVGVREVQLASLLQTAGLRTTVSGPAIRTATLRWGPPSEQLRFLRATGGQLLQHETGLRDKLTNNGNAPHNVLGASAHLGQHVLPSTLAGHAPKRVPGPSPVVDLADAEECDEALEDYQATRKRVSALARRPPGQVPLMVRVRSITEAVRSGVLGTLRFLVAFPGRVARFYGLPKVERKATYSRWWAVVKKEAKHYWVGTKLLAADVKIASRLVKRVLQGRTLSRRERNQLTRTTADIFRLVPMAVFVVIPFMELLLPVALKLFPNMLPSTFEDKLKKEEDMKRRISARLEIARFLQDTVTEMAEDIQEHRCGEMRATAADLYAFMQRVRAGQPVSTSELLKFAKLFNDELTLDNLERSQLVSLCRFVGLQPFGTDTFLRNRLRGHLQEIKEDDLDIQQEGLDTLTEDELRQACRARGMRAPFGEGSAAFMRDQLAEWLDWSLNRSLPSSLLLLSRAFTVTQPIGARPKVVELGAVRETLSTLPNDVVEDVELFATSDGGGKTESLERRLEVLEREEEMIEEEAEHLQAAIAISEQLPTTVAARATTAAEMTAAAAAAAVLREAAASAVADALEHESAEEKATKLVEAKQARMRKVITALAALASSSGVSNEREAFMQLVEKEIGRLESQLQKRGVGMVFSRGTLEVERQKQLDAVVGAKHLEDRIGHILARVERELDDADSKIGGRMHVLDLDGDGVITPDEIKAAMTFLREQLGEDELRHMLEMLSTESESSRGIDVGKLLKAAGIVEPAAEEERTPRGTPR